VADVEDADAVAHCQVFRCYVLVIDRHLEASEGCQFRCFAVYLIELGSARFSGQVRFLCGYLSYGYYVHVDGDECEFLAALGAFAFVLLQDFVWGFEFGAVVQNVAASLATDTLGHWIFSLRLLVKEVNVCHIYRLLNKASRCKNNSRFLFQKSFFCLLRQ